MTASADASPHTTIQAVNQGCVVVWFRRDWRLDDNPALQQAIAEAQRLNVPLLPVICSLPAAVSSRHGDIPRGASVTAWVEQAQRALADGLQALGSGLWCVADVAELIDLMQAAKALHVFAEDIALPYEQAEQAQVTQALKASGARATFVWQSALFNAEQLPFRLTELPKVFTAFRQKVENAGLRAKAPIAMPDRLPAAPDAAALRALATRVDPTPIPAMRDPRSSIATERLAGETGARAHWQSYLDRGLPHTYFETRNQLSGHDFSSQLSIDLAWGCVSVRRVIQMLDDFEATHGSTKSSYWLWFECMWREHFRWVARVHGARMFHARGLAPHAPKTRARERDWQRWTQGETGHALIDAGMHELSATGFLSNRMRQIVASYWLNDMGGDWRDGAAWFESQLLDEDPYSNTGNWLYIAGLGTDPRGGRRFDPDKQAREHDPQGAYRRLWA